LHPSGPSAAPRSHREGLDLLFVTLVLMHAVLVVEVWLWAHLYVESDGNLCRYVCLLPMILYGVAHVLVILLGVYCYGRWVRRRTPRHHVVVLGWVVGECAWYIVQVYLSATTASYFPGFISSTALAGICFFLVDAVRYDMRKRRRLT
jgi:uncharacterized BrkB/YihY/UPF0761 family membrane protein